MGFKRAKRRYRLQFDDPELEGFEVVMGSLSIGEFMDLTGSFTKVQGGDAAAGADSVSSLLTRFSKSIISWNLEDDQGKAVPATLTGVKGQEMDFIMTVVMAWMDAMSGVDPTSRATANGGGTLPEVSLPMERLSVSLPN